VSGEGRAPLNSALFAQPDELGYVGVFGFTSDTPDGAGDSVWTDHYFGQPAAPGTVCIAALMNATAIVRSNIFGVAVQ
jgi:hypothetical protein